jgi:hypothetical protein
MSSTTGYKPVSAIRNKHSIKFNERLINKNKVFTNIKKSIFSTMSRFLLYHQVDVLDNRLKQDVLDDHRNKTHLDNE